MTLKIMPMIRAKVVNALMDEYGLKQREVSEILDITQASVSHYRTRKRANDQKVMKQFPELDDYAKNLAKKLMVERDVNTQISLFCDVCRDLRSTEEFCSFHKISNDLSGCNVCFEDSNLIKGR
jgi:predicted transcriptional regulator